MLRTEYQEPGTLSELEALDLEFHPHACTAFVALLQFIRDHNMVAAQRMKRPRMHMLVHQSDRDRELEQMTCPEAGEQW
jgi:hypothetical protein